jgi:DNA-binding transcriptional ArsR family regulator
MTSYVAIASRLKAMGHPVRLQILDMLRSGEVCVCHIERTLNRRQAYVSQQLMTLRDAGLVTSRKDGLQVYYRLADDEIAELLHVLYGPPQSDGIPMLDNCNCPACSTALITDIA